MKSYANLQVGMPMEPKFLLVFFVWGSEFFHTLKKDHIAFYDHCCFIRQGLQSSLRFHLFTAFFVLRYYSYMKSMLEIQASFIIIIIVIQENGGSLSLIPGKLALKDSIITVTTLKIFTKCVQFPSKFQPFHIPCKDFNTQIIFYFSSYEFSLKLTWLFFKLSFYRVIMKYWLHSHL